MGPDPTGRRCLSAGLALLGRVLRLAERRWPRETVSLRQSLLGEHKARTVRCSDFPCCYYGTFFVAETQIGMAKPNVLLNKSPIYLEGAATGILLICRRSLFEM